MTKPDHLRSLCATLTVLVAAVVHASPFLLIGAWLAGVH